MNYLAGHSRRKTRILFFVILLGGVCKIALFFTVQSIASERIFSPDSPSYINTARVFLTTGHIAVSPDRPDAPQARRTPGYPLFIAGIFFFFGETWSALIVTQILLSLGTIIITYLIVSFVWDTRAAIISVCLLSLDIPSLVSSQKVMTETLFTFVLVVAILSVIAMFKTPRHAEFFLFSFGLALSVATLIRPISYYLLFPVIPCVIWILKTHFRFRRKKIIIAVLMLISPWMLLVGGWQLRNYIVTGKAEFSYIQGVNLLFYRGAGILAEREGIPFEEARDRLGYGRYAELHPETTGWSEAQLDWRWKHEGLQLIIQHPLYCLKSQIRGALTMLLGPGESPFLTYATDYQETSGPIGDVFRLSFKSYVQKWIIEKTGFFLLFLLAESHLLLVYTSIACSVWHLFKIENSQWGLHIVLWLILLYFIVISAGPEAYSRFRVPIMPIFCVYAGHGLSLILKKSLRLSPAKRTNIRVSQM